MATKYVHLIRHGQYHMDRNHPDHGSLTKLGAYQARCVARRLKEYQISKMHMSTMTRAQETGVLILEALDVAKSRSCRLLIEGIPELPKELIREKKLKSTQMRRTKKRMDSAFKKYFQVHRGKDECHEVLVCHGNIIRYFMTKVLGVKGMTWLKFDIYQCSISTVSIDDLGQMKLVSFADIGHIAPGKRTYL